MSAIEITAGTPAQPESTPAQTTQTEAATTQPQGTPTPEDPGKGKARKLGSEFAALDRRRKAVEQAEQEFKRQQAEFENSRKAVPDFSKSDTLELLESIAKARGLEPDALIKEYITRKTGAPAPQVALAQSTDPAIVALREQLKKDSDDKEALRKQIEERDRREQARLQAEAEAKATAACLDSSKAVYVDGSDYAFFWDTPELLAKDVMEACDRELVEYFRKYNTKPDIKDVEEMVREMPKELLKARLESHAGKRVLELKQRAAAPQQAAPIQGYKSPLRGNGDQQKKPKLVTRMDNDQRLEEAYARWPKGVPLPGQQPNSE